MDAERAVLPAAAMTAHAIIVINPTALVKYVPVAKNASYARVVSVMNVVKTVAKAGSAMTAKDA